MVEFRLNDVIKTQEAVQKEPDLLKRRPAPEFSFEEAIKHPKEFATSPEEEFVVYKGEDKLTLSQEGRTAYEITKLILGVLKTPDIREDKVHSAKRLLTEGRLLTRRGVVEIVANKLGRLMAWTVLLGFMLCLSFSSLAQGEKGMDVQAKDEKGLTLLHKSAMNGDIKMANILITSGAEVNAKNNDGLTPLHLGAMNGRKEVAELLITKGANVNAKSNEGVTPLLFTAVGGYKEVAEMLIAKGSDVNVKDNDGVTPLHGAVIGGHKEIVELLITKGADVNAKSNDGMTPLDIAIANGYNEIAELLKRELPAKSESTLVATVTPTPKILPLKQMVVIVQEAIIWDKPAIPNTSYKALTKIKQGTIVTILDATSVEWYYKVRLPDSQVGWICSVLLKEMR